MHLISHHHHHKGKKRFIRDEFLLNCSQFCGDGGEGGGGVEFSRGKLTVCSPRVNYNIIY
jgi:hypothetical protein